MTPDRGGEIQILWDSLLGLWNSFLGRLPFLAIGFLVFLGFLIGAQVVRKLLLTAGRRASLHTNLAQALSRVASALVIGLGIFVAAVVIFPAFKPGDLIAGLGITSVAVGFAFKDILQNFFAGILILWRQPFSVGDQIRSGDFEGTVEEINIRSTRLKTYDGDRAILPNGDVYTRAILVHTAYDKRRVRFTVGVGYPDSLEKARQVIFDVVDKSEGVLPDPGPWVYVSELAASSVNFTVYFWVQPQQSNVLKVSDRVATGIKLALDAAHIDMPYPHIVLIQENPSMSPTGKGEGK
ncbi:MAG: mechanosensitive ion channel family protein [Bryobacteraceae bacterium]